MTTYKTLQPFVSTTLLQKLIAKQVWTTAPLWEGFIRCAKTIQPHSFGALLLLPKEQLRDVIMKQPSLKEPLREYAIKRASRLLSLALTESAGLLSDFEFDLPQELGTRKLGKRTRRARSRFSVGHPSSCHHLNRRRRKGSRSLSNHLRLSSSRWRSRQLCRHAHCFWSTGGFRRLN